MTEMLAILSIPSLLLLGLVVLAYRQCLDYQSLAELESRIYPFNPQRLNFGDLWVAWYNTCLIMRVCTLTLDPSAYELAKAIRLEAKAYRWLLLKAFLFRRVVYIGESISRYELLLGLIEDARLAEATP